MACDFELLLNSNRDLIARINQLARQDQIAALFALTCDYTQALVPATVCDPIVLAQENAGCMRCFSEAEMLGMIASMLCGACNPTGCAPPVISDSPLPDAVINVAYSATIPTLGQTGTHWTLQSGTLPAGLTLNSSTGQISGTPTTVGISNFAIRAANACGQDIQAYTVNVLAACAIPELKDSGNIPGVVGSPMTFVPDIAGTAPLTVTITSGTLPAGLTLNAANGVISGTPTVSGTTPITLQVTNACGSDTSNYTILISNPHIYWGNFAGPVPSVFGASQILALPANGGGEWAPSTRAATYHFNINGPPSQFQVWWFADSYLPPAAAGTVTFKSAGLTFPLQPTSDQPYQALTVSGVPGKVYVSANANGGPLDIVVT